MNLAEALPQEINRVRELQDQYKALRGQPGVFVDLTIAIMGVSLHNAIRVSTSGDVLEMLRAYEDLKGYE
jgi:hypothetical protein